jgi:hypothetical protein
MSRIILYGILIFLAPFLLYGLHRLLLHRGEALLRRTPWFALTMTGMGLAAAALVALGFLGGQSPDGVYVPPHLDAQGRVVPGTMRPREDGD